MAFEISPSLVEAARCKGSTEIDRLLEAIWPDAYRLAYAILGERHAAEDAAQEASIVVYRKIGSLRSAAAFRVWLYRIVVREASALKKKGSRMEPSLESTPILGEWAGSLDVWNALRSLPAHLRDVVVLRYFEDLSSREIATILRIPSGTVRFHLSVAMKKMRPLVTEIPSERIGVAPVGLGVRAIAY